MTTTHPEDSSTPESLNFDDWADDLDRRLNAFGPNYPATGKLAGREEPLNSPKVEKGEEDYSPLEGVDDSPPQEVDPTPIAPVSITPSSKSTTPNALEAFISPSTLLLARLIGYGLLLIGFVDFLYILIPPQLTNPVWEYQAMGDIVKLVPVPLLALLLIFAGEKSLRRKLEPKLLTALSWIALVASIFFFLLLPLIITDSFRIDSFNNAQINTEVNQQKQKLNATQNQLQKMDSEQLKYFIPTPDKTGSLGLLPNSIAQAKSSITENLERAKAKADIQAAEARKNVTANLVKNTFKLFMESLISAVLFLMLWSRTDWARQKPRRGGPQPQKSSKPTSTPKRVGRSSQKRRH